MSGIPSPPFNGYLKKLNVFTNGSQSIFLTLMVCEKIYIVRKAKAHKCDSTCPKHTNTELEY